MFERKQYTIEGITVSATSYNQALIAINKIKRHYQQADKNSEFMKKQKGEECEK